MNEPREITVIKQNAAGQEVWRYGGRLLRHTPNARLIAAPFNRDSFIFEGIPFNRGDLFIEAFYAHRWFNVFEIHDASNGAVKGWYCNVTRPAMFSDGMVASADLALDLLVYPDGSFRLLDEDEFADLQLDAETQAKALAAVEALKRLFSLGTDLRLEQIFPVTDPYEARLKMSIARGGWQVEHLTFEQSTHSVAEAAEAVGASPHDLVKNICLIAPDNRLVVAIVNGDDRVSPANVAESLGLDGLPRLATADDILARTGYPMGGTPSFGFAALFIMDEHTFDRPLAYTGGGSPHALVRGNPYEFQRANGGLTAAIRK